MKLKVFFVADPTEKLNPSSDSSLVLLRESLKRGYRAFWVTDDEVEYVNGKVILRSRRCLSCPEGGLPVLGDTEVISADSFDVGFIRKDPPFNEDYVRLCWILSLCEKKVFYINKPSLLVRYHEKLLPFEAHSQGYLKLSDLIPTHLGSGPSAAAFVQKLQTDSVISKPFLGHGGKNISQIEKKEFIKNSLSQPQKWQGVVVQPFLDEVLTEDRRLIYFSGKLVGQFVRIPPKGGFIANLAQGGTAETKELTRSQKNVAERVGIFLKKANILFAGVDLIGSKVSEINITSPTGFLAYRKLTGEDLSSLLLSTIERNFLRHKR
jgi:glutathione synthase